MIAMTIGACTSEPVALELDLDAQNDAFCNLLQTATGPEGAEAQFDPLDPGRLDATVEELRELDANAPRDIKSTTAAAVELFETVQRTPSNEMAQVLVENELAIADMSLSLTEYAVDECGLFLQRAPLPTPESAPLITNE